MKCWLALLGATSLLTGACSTPKIGGGENIQVVEGSQLPPPSQPAPQSINRAYVIGPGDQLSIDVFGAPDLSKSVQVDSAGRISLPLAGEFSVTGTTPSELGDAVEAELLDYVKTPQVTVNLVQAVSQSITVDGEVAKPGVYPVVGRLTLMRAIATAQGTTEIAAKSHVVVFRKVGDQQMVALYDLRAIRRGLYQDPEVYAHDVVVVGEAQARRLFQELLQGATILTTPIIALIQR